MKLKTKREKQAYKEGRKDALNQIEKNVKGTRERYYKSQEVRMLEALKKGPLFIVNDEPNHDFAETLCRKGLVDIDKTGPNWEVTRRETNETKN